MALDSIDWKELRGSGTVLAVALAIGGALVYWGIDFSSAAELEYKKGQSRFQAARRRYSTLDEQQRLIEQYYPQYQALEQAGVVGAEQRLNWIETLGNLARGLKIPVMRYEISSQEEFQPGFAVSQGAFKVFATEMRLTTGLLHEGDLPAIITALNEAASGLFTVSGCSMSRSTTTVIKKNDPRVPTVNAQCQLRWYIVKTPEAPS